MIFVLRTQNFSSLKGLNPKWFNPTMSMLPTKVNFDPLKFSKWTLGWQFISACAKERAEYHYNTYVILYSPFGLNLASNKLIKFSHNKQGYNWTLEEAEKQMHTLSWMYKYVSRSAPLGKLQNCKDKSAVISSAEGIKSAKQICPRASMWVLSSFVCRQTSNTETSECTTLVREPSPV